MSEILRESALSGRRKIQIVQGDITQEEVDAIVNAANAHLIHGGGLAAAILRRGGEQIRIESDAWIREHGPVSHASPAYTSGGDLPCRYVIHAVGPVWGEGDEDAKLRSTVIGALSLADHLELKTLALPAISTGIFGFPKDRAARIILRTISEYFISNPSSGLLVVRVTLFDAPTVEAFIQAWDAMEE